MKQVRILLSVAAIIFAVAGVLATSNSHSETVAIDVSYAVGNCNEAGTCSQSSSAQCKNTATQALLYERSNESTCNVIATGVFAP